MKEIEKLIEDLAEDVSSFDGDAISQKLYEDQKRKVEGAKLTQFAKIGWLAKDAFTSNVTDYWQDKKGKPLFYRASFLMKISMVKDAIRELEKMEGE